MSFDVILIEITLIVLVVVGLIILKVLKQVRDGIGEIEDGMPQDDYIRAIHELLARGRMVDESTWLQWTEDGRLKDTTPLPEHVECPHCKRFMYINYKERTLRRFICSECDEPVDRRREAEGD